VLARHAERIAATYGCGAGAELRGPVARGEQGEIWQLVTPAGTWAVKLLYEDQDPAEAQADAVYQGSVRRTGVPMPAVRRTVDGGILCVVDGTLVRVYEWVDVLEPDPSIDPASVGSLVAANHGVRSLCPTRPVDPWYIEPVGAERWDEIVEALVAKEAPFETDLAVLRDEQVALEGLLSPPRDLQVCHRDLWADNVRGTPSGGLCVIDWENGGLADPNQELGIALFEFGLGDAARERALYKGYLDGGGRGRIEGPGDFSMLIAQLAHLTEWACVRWLEAGASESERLRGAARVREQTSRPLTIEVVRNMLDALAV
jgi:Ser/Thr protein kinase RdoA (MazF antagonist)